MQHAAKYILQTPFLCYSFDNMDTKYELDCEDDATLVVGKNILTNQMNTKICGRKSGCVKHYVAYSTLQKVH